MNIFVASWFFPPSTSSEGIVTYKLLRNSGHQYDVISSTSTMWSYNHSMMLHNDTNIHVESMETNSIDEWVEASVLQFEKLYPQRQYDCIMTRSTPPESILVGQRIKEKYPHVKWIASLADPVANNPYELISYIDDTITLTAREKTTLRQVLRSGNIEALTPWKNRPESGIQLLCKLKEWEHIVLQQADLIISPTGTQLRYINEDQSWNNKFFVLPHSFDKELYPQVSKVPSEKIIFSYIGYSDKLRSLEPIVRAVRLLQQNGCPFLDKLEIRFIGNYPRAIQDMVLNYYLDTIIKCYPAVDYFESLALMQTSDWLIHVDAYFPELQTGGSIFFAGKLADYMGTSNPILALTGSGSPACEIVTKAGGVCVHPQNISEIADCIEIILSGHHPRHINQAYIQSYDAKAVARRFDNQLDILTGGLAQLRVKQWPESVETSEEKLITICVPSFNVQRYLERCLSTLVDHSYAPHIEILVIDDGSKDSTAEIAMEFEKHYSGIIRLIRKPNGGHGSTINRAIQEGCGKYFMIVDGDDWIDSRQFSQLVEKIASGEISSDVISSNYHHINMETSACIEWKQQTEVSYFQEYTFEQLDTENVYFTLASSLFRLDILKEMNMPLQEHTFYVDVEYILFPVPYLHTVTFVDYYIYKYVQGNAEQSIHIPTMVNRYDHHERVMRSVISYSVSMQMSDAQHAYYYAILKRLLYSHYALCLVYDGDKKRGYSRCRDFDCYLFETVPELAKWIGTKMPLLRVARRYHFDAGRAERSLSGKVIAAVRRQKPAIKQKLRSSRILRKVVNNRFTRIIAKNDYFTHGTGYKIKHKIMSLLSP